MSATSRRMGLAEFNELLADAPDDERLELVDGRVVRMMVGARREHAHIVANLHGALWQRLRANGSRCHAYSESSRVQVDAAEASFMPDIVVTCEPMERGATSLKAPVVLMEVLSEGTARHDRGDKWTAYQKIASLRHYVLVESGRPDVEVFDLRDAVWRQRTVRGIGATLALPAIDIDLPLAEIYADLVT